MSAVVTIHTSPRDAPPQSGRASAGPSTGRGQQSARVEVQGSSHSPAPPSASREKTAADVPAPDSGRASGRLNRVHPEPTAPDYADQPPPPPPYSSGRAGGGEDEPLSPSPERSRSGNVGMLDHVNAHDSGPGILHPTPARGKRSSVFTGQPEAAAPAPASSPSVDEDDEEDEVMKKSAFNRQRSIIQRVASSHRLELLEATFNVCVHIGTLITDLILIADYSSRGDHLSASALAVIRIIVGLVEIEFDYLHRGWGNGRWMFVPLIFFNFRIVVDYVRYLRDWRKYQNREWANADFRAACSFETFIGSLPSLIVQTYVMINGETGVIQDKWIVGYVMTALSGAIDLLHHFKYVRVARAIYISQFVKAFITVGMRSVLVAQLLITIGKSVMGWMVVSFLAGAGMYYIALKYSQKIGRDNPFEYGALVSHLSFGGLISATVLFVSIPFAPSHSIYDWWLGYMLCEAKMALENFIMLGVVLGQVWGDYSDQVFYSVMGFTFVCYIGNLFAIWFLHQEVRKQLNKRDIYSDTAIVKLFAHFLYHFKLRYHPESVEKLGSAQTSMLYKDKSGAVPERMQVQHTIALKRQQTQNAAAMAKHGVAGKKGSLPPPETAPAINKVQTEVEGESSSEDEKA